MRLYYRSNINIELVFFYDRYRAYLHIILAILRHLRVTSPHWIAGRDLVKEGVCSALGMLQYVRMLYRFHRVL